MRERALHVGRARHRPRTHVCVNVERVLGDAKPPAAGALAPLGAVRVAPDPVVHAGRAVDAEAANQDD